MTLSSRLALALFAVAPSLLAAQAKTAALAGTVRDTLGNPLRMVAVMVESTELSAVTDDSGRFHIKGVPAGRNDFTVRRIGFAAVEFGTTLAADSTLVIDIRMKPLTTLGAVNVTGERSARLEKTGYFERQRTGLGSFVSPEKVDSLNHLPYAGYLLRGMRGLDVSCGPRGCGIKSRLGPPCLHVFVNGGWRDGSLDDNVAMSEVYAIEVYEKALLVPSEFQGKLPMRQAGRGLTGKAGCGAIAVWTRGRAAP